MNEMITAGDIGSATTGGTAPMVRYGDKEVLKRMDILKKQAKNKMKIFKETDQFNKYSKEKKMKTFKEYIAEAK